MDMRKGSMIFCWEFRYVTPRKKSRSSESNGWRGRRQCGGGLGGERAHESGAGGVRLWRVRRSLDKRWGHGAYQGFECGMGRTDRKWGDSKKWTCAKEA